MAKIVQVRRGTTAALSSVTGAEGELFVDTDKETLTVHNNYQAGGFPLLREDLNNLAASAITPAMLANGAANQLLRTNAAGNGVEWFTQSLAGRFMGVQALGPGASLSGDTVATHSSRTGSSGTWTRPAGVNSVLAYVTGGGGGSEYEDNSYRNAGGGGGGTAIKWIQNVAASVSWTVGSGGAHGTPAGANGGTSSFGSHCSGLGGQGGQDGVNSQYGARGGGATGGDLNIPGGGAGFSHSSNSEQGGGMSFWTQAGSSHHPNAGSQGGSSHGRLGAGGGWGYYSQSDRNAYNGGAGIILLYYYS